jgi:hypothetical protein
MQCTTARRALDGGTELACPQKIGAVFGRCINTSFHASLSVLPARSAAVNANTGVPAPSLSYRRLMKRYCSGERLVPCAIGGCFWRCR